MSEEIDAGGIIFHLLGDTSELKKMIAEAQHELNEFAEKMESAFGPIAEFFQESAKEFGELSAQMNQLNMQTGLSVETLSELSYAAVISDTNIQELTRAFRVLEMHLDMAGKHGGRTSLALNRLGLSASQLKQMKPDEQFEAISEALSKIPDDAERTKLAMELFGRQAYKLIPLLKEGKEGLQKLKEEAHKFGYVLDSEAVKAGAAFNDSMDSMHQGLKLIVYEIGGAVAPVIKEWADYIREHIGVIRAWIREHKDLIQTIAKIVFAIVAMVAALKAVSMAYSLVSNTISGIIQGVQGMIAVFEGLLTVMRLVFWTLMANPFLAAAAAIIAAGTALLYYAQAWKEAEQASGASRMADMNALAKGNQRDREKGIYKGDPELLRRMSIIKQQISMAGEKGERRKDLEEELQKLTDQLHEDQQKHFEENPEGPEHIKPKSEEQQMMDMVPHAAFKEMKGVMATNYSGNAPGMKNAAKQVQVHSPVMEQTLKAIERNTRGVGTLG